MRQAYIFGAGGHARVIASLIEGQITFIDANAEAAYLARAEDLRRGRVYVGIGDNAIRRRVFERLRGLGIVPADCVAPTAFVARGAHLGGGTVICPGAVVMTGARIGANVIINTLASVDHDCTVGDHSQLCPRVTLAGEVEIGEGVFLGTAAAVVPGVKIGAYAKVRAGSIVWKDVDAKTLVGGNPASLIDYM